MARFWLKFQQSHIEIPAYEEHDGVVFYKIHVHVNDISWTVKHRYNDFCELHEELVNNHGVSKDILPSKKLIKNAEFIENRRRDLETYLQKVLKFLLLTMPKVFVEFLEFHVYDVFFLLEKLAGKFCVDSHKKSHQFSTLEMHAIRMCCGTLVPPNNYISDRKHDISHVWDFCLQLKTLSIYGSDNHLNSNINPNKLCFDFKNFKNINCLNARGICLDSVKELGNLRENLSKLSLIQSNLTQLCHLLQCDILHKHNFDKTQIWINLHVVDLSYNFLTEMDDSLRLVPNLRVLILNNNRFSKIPNLSVLEQLTDLSISDNLIEMICRPMNSLLPSNIQCLNLSSNRISSLECFSQLFSLKNLDLTSNNIVDIKQVEYLTNLQNLTNLNLTGNFISTVVDYRIRVLENFDTRTICLDNEQTTKEETDKISIRKAIRIMKEVQ